MIVFARLRTIAGAGVLMAATVAGSMAYAAPTLQQISGQLDHKKGVTLSGSGFGAKAIAAPLVWDDASGNSITAKWDGRWPSNNASYNTDYRAPMRNIALPHNNINRYISGAHAQSAGANAGYNVIFWKNVTKPNFIYASWYQRMDDAWVFGGDDNFKTFAYSVCCSPYELPNNWYLEYNSRPTSRTSGAAWHINDDGSSLQSPDAKGQSWWWGGAINPMAGNWTKIEVALKISSGSDGYIKQWENGNLKIDYAGPTDKYSGNSRSIGIGGYARMYGQPNNWRYYADVYMDTTLARVVLANNQDLARATIVETQVPTAWGDNSIKFDVNLGRLSPGQTAYLFVVDGAGARNSAGFPVTVGANMGGGGSAAPPSVPTGVTVQ